MLEIERLERALARRPRMAERLFTETERSYAVARARPGQHLAARFCAKEAVRVVIGKGNNGGDGLVVARLLRDEGRDVDVLATGDLAELKGDARVNLERLPGDPPESFEASKLEGSGAIVDAIFGTGFEGEPREPVASAIEAINQADAPVVACDVPSGVNAANGEIAGQAVRAVATGTF